MEMKSRKNDRGGARKSARRGATLVEFAVIVPVFGLMMLGILEFGHIYMVYNTMTAAAKQAARFGAVEGVSNGEVATRATNILGAAIDVSHATVLVKDASVFDTDEVEPTDIEYNELPNIELDTMEPRQLFLVYITVPYTEVALLPPVWARNLTLTAQSVMRHE